MKVREFSTPKEALTLEQELRTAARTSIENLQKMIRTREPLQVLQAMKFDKSGRDPLDCLRPLNLVEQLNQTFTYLVSLRAVEFLFRNHRDAAPFRVNLGTAAGADVESVDGAVAAEVFAAVRPHNNNKLQKDIAKVAATDALHRYVFFYCPGEHVPDERDGVRIVPVALDFSCEAAEEAAT